MNRAQAVVADFRKVIRQDPRIIQKLHRRVFVDKITRDQVCASASGMCDSGWVPTCLGWIEQGGAC